jgi:pSer/pThr/pTyr-binding forkhead associated (FHA) protein
MASLILHFEDQLLKEYQAGLMMTIGRLPDNTVILENPAVSGHHACIFRDGERFVVEDLQSTNGTFVNETRVTRHTLQHGDVVLVGKHRLVFDQLKGGETDERNEPELTIPNQGDTVLLDTRKHRALLNRLMDAEAHAGRVKAGDAEPATVRGKVGALRVLAGRANQLEYTLQGHTSLIGKGEGCLVRLQGWFKPEVAVAITRNRLGYVATLTNGHAQINSQPLRERYELKDGDLLQVSGLTLEFRLKEAVDDARRPVQASTSTAGNSSDAATSTRVRVS